MIVSHNAAQKKTHTRGGKNSGNEGNCCSFLCECVAVGVSTLWLNLFFQNSFAVALPVRGGGDERSVLLWLQKRFVGTG